jgi:hypothetical protein
LVGGEKEGVFIFDVSERVKNLDEALIPLSFLRIL